MTNEDFKKETIAMLRIIKANSHSTTLDDKPTVVIENCSLDSFLWVINQAIAQIKDDRPDWRDC